MIRLRYTVGSHGPYTVEFYTNDPAAAVVALGARLGREQDSEHRPGEGQPLYVEFEEVDGG